MREELTGVREGLSGRAGGATAALSSGPAVARWSREPLPHPEFAHKYDDDRFNVEDSGYTEDLGPYRVPNPPYNPFLPRSFRMWGYGNAHEGLAVSTGLMVRKGLVVRKEHTWAGRRARSAGTAGVRARRECRHGGSAVGARMAGDGAGGA